MLFIVLQFLHNIMKSYSRPGNVQETGLYVSLIFTNLPELVYSNVYKVAISLKALCHDISGVCY